MKSRARSIGIPATACGSWNSPPSPIPASVPAVIAGVLGVPKRPGRALTEALSDALREKSLLIVLDNCEHLLVACAWLCDAPLRVGTDQPRDRRPPRDRQTHGGGHVQAILNKLGFDSRAQIAAWVIEHGFRDPDL